MVTSKPVKYLCCAGLSIFVVPVFLKTVHPDYKQEKNRPESVAIVTGANGLLGSAVAHHFAIRKMRVIMACKDMDQCKSIRRQIVLTTNNKKLACRYLDLEDIDSINRFADDVIEKEPHINILVNSAGISETNGRELTKHGIEKHFAVNFLGPYLLTLRLIDKLAESAKVTRDSRIVNVVATPKRRWKIDFDDINFDKRPFKNKLAYEQSKLALAHFTILLEKLMREQKNNIYVFGFAPSTTKIKSHLELPVDEITFTKLTYGTWFTNDSASVVGSVVKAALHKKAFERSGCMYNYFGQPLGRNKGWGPRLRNEWEGKHIWKFAGDLLLQIGDQLKQEEKSKASVDESA